MRLWVGTSTVAVLSSGSSVRPETAKWALWFLIQHGVSFHVDVSEQFTRSFLTDRRRLAKVRGKDVLCMVDVSTLA